jgi:hypothetical protein
MGAGLLAVKSGFILFIKNYQFFYTINTLDRDADLPHQGSTVDASIVFTAPRAHGTPLRSHGENES